MIQFIRLFIDRNVYAYILIILTLLAGSLAFQEIRNELIPTQPSLTFNLETNYQNYPPVVVEKVITIPLEFRLSDLKLVESIVSISEQGKSIVSVNFSPVATYTTSLIDLYEIVDNFSLTLPSDSHKTQVLNYTPEDSPVFVFSYSSPSFSPRELRKIIETELNPKLGRLPGVADIKVYGGEVEELIIRLKKKYLDIINNTDNKIQQALQENNFFTVLGEIDSEGLRKIYSIDNKLTNESQLGEIYINQFGQAVSLTSVSDYYLGSRELENLSFVNGKEDVSMAIFVNRNTPLLETGKEITKVLQSEMDDLKKKFPQQIDLIEVTNTYKLILKEIQHLYAALMVGVVFLILFVFLIIRNPVLIFFTLLSIPFSLAGMIFFLYQLGMTLNVYTLIGISLSTGILVDVCIILMEKYLSHPLSENVYDLREIVFQDTLETMRPIFIGFTTSVIVFTPIFFSPKFIKDQFQDIAMTITLGLLVSFIYAVLVLPSMFTVWYKSKTRTSRVTIENSKTSYHFFYWMKAWTQLLKRKLMIIYYMTLVHVLRNRKLMVSIFGVISLFLTVILVLTARYDIQNIKTDEKVSLSYEFSPGIQLAKMKNYVFTVYQELLKRSPSVKNVFIKISKYRGNLTFTCQPEIFFHSCYQEIHSAVSTMKEVPFGYLHFDIKSLDTTHKQLSQHEITIDLLGQEYEEIEKYIYAAGNHVLRNSMVGELLYHFRKDFKEYQFTLNKDKVVGWKLQPSRVSQNVYLRKEGYIAEKYTPIPIDGQEKSKTLQDIRVTGDIPGGDLGDMLILNLTTTQDEGNLNQTVLGDLGSFTTEFSLSKRFRKNKNKVLSFSVRSISGASYSDFYNEVKKTLDEISLPERYYFEVQGKENLDSLKNFIVLYSLVGLYLIYFSCASLYRSFLQPLIILTALFFSLLANMLWIGYHRSTFDLPTILALGILLGLGVNNFTIFYEEMIKIKQRTSNTFSIILNSFYKKKGSILVSTTSTMIALLPGLFTDNYFYNQVSFHLIIGLLWNLLLTFCIFPVLFFQFPTSFTKNKTVISSYSDQ